MHGRPYLSNFSSAYLISVIVTASSDTLRRCQLTRKFLLEFPAFCSISTSNGTNRIYMSIFCGSVSREQVGSSPN